MKQKIQFAFRIAIGLDAGKSVLLRKMKQSKAESYPYWTLKDPNWTSAGSFIWIPTGTMNLMEAYYFDDYARIFARRSDA